MAVPNIGAGESGQERQSPQRPGQQPRPQGQHPDPHLTAAVVDEPQVHADFGFDFDQALHHGGRGARGVRGGAGPAARPRLGWCRQCRGRGLAVRAILGTALAPCPAEVRATKCSCQGRVRAARRRVIYRVGLFNALSFLQRHPWEVRRGCSLSTGQAALCQCFARPGDPGCDERTQDS